MVSEQSIRKLCEHTIAIRSLAPNIYPSIYLDGDVDEIVALALSAEANLFAGGPHPETTATAVFNAFNMIERRNEELR